MPPPPAPKRKGKKKKVLDPVALERARIEEAEKRRRQLAMLQARIHEILEEERTMSAVASKAIEARWIIFLRECKQKELVADIEVVRRGFEGDVDRKDAVISMLFSDLDEAEEQYRHVFRSHVDVVDSLIGLQNRHTEELEAEFEADLLEMKADYERERTELERNHLIEMEDLRLILQNMAAEAELLEKKLQEEISEAHETAIEKMDEEKKQMQAELARTSEGVRSELDTRYKEFMATAQVNMKDYMDKSKEDQETTERIALQLKKIDKLQESVTSWRTNIARSAKEWEQRNTSIQAERDATLKHLQNLKSKMQIWRRKQAADLAELVKDAKSAEDSLETTAKKAERILRLVELCKPMETERERVLSYESNTTPREIEQDVRRRVAAAEPGALETDKNASSGPATTAEWQCLERFWTKHNKVMLDNAAILQERHHLEQENQQLQSLLRQYLDDVSVNDSVMRSSNALLLTRNAPNVVQSASTAASEKERAFNTVVVEGNKFVADVSRQMVRR